MKSKGIIIFLACLLLLVGCGSKAVEQAEEIEKTDVAEQLGEVSYEKLTKEQLDIFEEIGKVGAEEVKIYSITIDMLEQTQNDLILDYIQKNELPSNSLELFNEWKEKTNYYSQFENEEPIDNINSESEPPTLEEQKEPEMPLENGNQNPAPPEESKVPEKIEYDTVTIHAPSDPLPYEDFKAVFLPKVLDASKTYGQSPEGYERMVIECEPEMLKQYEWRYNEDGLREYKIGRVHKPNYEEWLTAENLLAHITFFDIMVEETGTVDMSTEGYDVEGW